MLRSYATAVIAIVLLAVGWVAVQRAWRRAFPGAWPDPDTLAGRTDCHPRDCGDACRRRKPERSGPDEEGLS